VSEPRLVERCSSFSDAIVVVFCAVVVVMAVGGSGFWFLGSGLWVHGVCVCFRPTARAQVGDVRSGLEFVARVVLVVCEFGGLGLFVAAAAARASRGRRDFSGSRSAILALPGPSSHKAQCTKIRPQRRVAMPCIQRLSLFIHALLGLSSRTTQAASTLGLKTKPQRWNRDTKTPKFYK
jgi:hypothetical protein